MRDPNKRSLYILSLIVLISGIGYGIISPIIPVFAPEGFVKRLMQGTMKVSKERTRDTATVTTP